MRPPSADLNGWNTHTSNELNLSLSGKDVVEVSEDNNFNILGDAPDAEGADGKEDRPCSKSIIV